MKTIATSMLMTVIEKVQRWPCRNDKSVAGLETYFVVKLGQLVVKRAMNLLKSCKSFN